MKTEEYFSKTVYLKLPDSPLEEMSLKHFLEFQVNSENRYYISENEVYKKTVTPPYKTKLISNCKSKEEAEIKLLEFLEERFEKMELDDPEFMFFKNLDSLEAFDIVKVGEKWYHKDDSYFNIIDEFIESESSLFDPQFQIKDGVLIIKSYPTEAELINCAKGWDEKIGTEVFDRYETPYVYDKMHEFSEKYFKEYYDLIDKMNALGFEWESKQVEGFFDFDHEYKIDLEDFIKQYASTNAIQEV